MNKDQAIHSFFSSFNWMAYDENSVPENEPFPYITHEGSVDLFGTEIAQTGSIWTRSSSWSDAINKRIELEQRIGRGGILLTYDGGAVWIRMGTPWAQRLGDAGDDMVKRIVFNYTVEFID